jgi:hypothetical protein
MRTKEEQKIAKDAFMQYSAGSLPQIALPVRREGHALLASACTTPRHTRGIIDRPVANFSSLLPQQIFE